MKTIQRNSLKNGLKPSWTAYRKWGKRGGGEIRFAKSGAAHLEKAYATHFAGKQKPRREDLPTDAASEENAPQATCAAGPPEPR